MTRRGSAGVFAEALLLGLLVGVAEAADLPAASTPRQHRRIQLFQAQNPRGSLRLLGTTIAPLPHRVRLEVTGARTNAQDWLHNAGFSFLEERDPEGHRSYTLLSSALASAAPSVRLQARIGRPQVAAGLQQNHNSTTVGLTIPWQSYVVELEGIDDRSLGRAFLGSLRWHDAHNRVEYGVGVPLTTHNGLALGVLFQVRFKLTP